MRYLSVCSGIEAATAAWKPLGMEAVAFSEIERFPCSVLAHHYPSVPNWGDMNDFRRWPDANVDVLVGGTPCQSFSVAGLRAGLADPRGNLALVYLAIADRYRPRWLVWENVPGVFSSTSHAAPDPCPPPPPVDLGCDGAEVETEDEYTSEELHAFYCFLAGVSELGYGFAYRVLDAQYFGVPQRRRRVFVVGHLGDWRPAAAVLFEPSCLRGDPPPSREARKDAAGCIGGGPDGGRVAVVSKWAKGSGGPAGDECYNMVAHPLRGEGFDAGEDGTGRGIPLVADPLTTSLGGGQYCNSGNNPRPRNLIAFDLRGRDGGAQFEGPHETANIRAASGGSSRSYVVDTAVRRLTPLECERLQGFPDGYTDIPGARDSARYKALGNSMAVPVMRWIGRRLLSQRSTDHSPKSGT